MIKGLCYHDHGRFKIIISKRILKYIIIQNNTKTTGIMTLVDLYSSNFLGKSLRKRLVMLDRVMRETDSNKLRFCLKKSALQLELALYSNMR